MSEGSSGRDSTANRLLVIEKHPDVRASLCDLIETWRWPDFAVEATDGFAGATRLLAAQWPSLVLLDMELPNGASISLLQWIKARQPYTPVIAWMLYPTSWADALAAGADVCLDKGAPAWELKQTIGDWCCPKS